LDQGDWETEGLILFVGRLFRLEVLTLIFVDFALNRFFGLQAANKKDKNKQAQEHFQKQFFNANHPQIQYFQKILYLLWLVCILLEKHVFHLNGNRPKIQYFWENIVFAVVGLHFV